MTMPANVIYLPPGVIPPQVVSPSAPGTGIPFDRQFFEAMLPEAVKSYCDQTHCASPQVTIATVDGMTHHIVGISGVANNWVAVHATREEHPHPMQIFLPYQIIYRIEIHPEGDEDHHHLGFILPTDAHPTPAVQPAAALSKKARRPAAKKK